MSMNEIGARIITLGGDEAVGVWNALSGEARSVSPK
jgi:hypothetical protein